MPLGFSKACRTCLTLDGTLISIYDSEGYDGQGRIKDMIEEITTITPMKTDGLPELVCQTCFNEINRCFTFKVKCINSDSTLRKLFAADEETGQQQVQTEEFYKNQRVPIIDSLILLKRAVEQPAVAIKTEEIPAHDSFSYFVITPLDEDSETETREVPFDGRIENVKIEEESGDDCDEDNTSHTKLFTGVKKDEMSSLDDCRSMNNDSPEPICVKIKTEPIDESIQFEAAVDGMKVNSTETQISPSRRSYQCPKCEKVFLYISRLKEHLTAHSTHRPFKCTICDKSFKQNGHLKSHIDINHRKIKRFECKKCNKLFSCNSNLQGHMKTHNKMLFRRNNSNAFKKCNKIEPTTDELTNMLIYENDDRKPGDEEKKYFGKQEDRGDSVSICPTANMPNDIETKAETAINESFQNTLPTRRSYRPLKDGNHSSPESTGVQIKTRSSDRFTPQPPEEQAQNEINDNKGVDAVREYTCTHCPKVFKYISRLNEHLRSHSSERPFDCHICGKNFKQINHVMTHIKLSHKKKPFKCSKCIRCFASRSLLKKHLKTHISKDKHFPTKQSYVPDTTLNDKQYLEKEQLFDNEPVSDDELPSDDGKPFDDGESFNEEQLLNMEQDSLFTQTDNNTVDPSDEQQTTSDGMKKQQEIETQHENIPKPNDQQEDDHTTGCMTLSRRSNRAKKEVIYSCDAEETPPSHSQTKNETDKKDDDLTNNFECPICKRDFFFVSRLTAHMRSHSEERPFPCSMCSKSFKLDSNLQSHIMICHKKLRPYNCSECSRTFSCTSNLRKHLKIHNKTLSRRKPKRRTLKKKNQKKQPTHDLNFEQEVEQIEDIHEMEEVPEGQENSQENVSQELDVAKDNVLLTVECQLCSASVSPDNLTEHMQETHNLPESTSVVLKSQKITNPEHSNQSELEIQAADHSQSLNDYLKSNYKCTICDKQFPFNSRLKEHMRTHSNDRPFECSLCDKSFKQKCHLKSHILINHKKLKPFKCNMCFRTFSSSSNLKQHMKTHFGNGRRKHRKYPQYTVEESPDSQKRLSDLNAELKNLSMAQEESQPKQNLEDDNEDETEVDAAAVVEVEVEVIEDEIDVNDKMAHESPVKTPLSSPNSTSQSNMLTSDTSHPIQCLQCNKVFSYVSLLSKHLKTHSDERPYACLSCDKTFKQSSHLKSHIMIRHKKLKPFKCQECFRLFSCNSNLTKHMKTHNGKGSCRKTKMKRLIHRRNINLISELAPIELDNESKTGQELEVEGNIGFNEIKNKVSVGDTELSSVKSIQEQPNSSKSEKQKNSPKSDELQILKPLSSTTSPPFQCYQCNKEFTFISRLNEHMRTHSDERPFICSICGKTFKQNGHLKTHIMISHDKYKPYKCEDCPREFSSNFNLQVHLKTHCAKGNRRKARRNNDYLEQPHNITSDDKTTESDNISQQNIYGNLSFWDDSNQVSGSSLYLTPRHSQQKHSTPQSKKVAVKSVHANIDSIPKEVDNSLANSTNPLQCHLCNKVFTYSSALGKHLRTHSDDRPYVCSLCGKTFKQSGHLKSHVMISHDKIKPYKCEKCFRDFSSNYNRKVHKCKFSTTDKSHRRSASKSNAQDITSNEDIEELLLPANNGEENTVEKSKNNTKNTVDGSSKIQQKRNRCSICYIPVELEHLTEHMQQFHNPPLGSTSTTIIKQEPLDEPEHEGHPLFDTLSNQVETGDGSQLLHCTECNKEFTFLSRLTEHMRSHSDERPFICTICNKSFKQKGHLKSHIMINHKKILPYKCNECLRSFPSRYNLKIHQKTHRGKRRAAIKKSYYKDPPYHGKTLSNTSPEHDQLLTKENTHEHTDIFLAQDIINKTIENQFALEREKVETARMELPQSSGVQVKKEPSEAPQQTENFVHDTIPIETEQSRSSLLCLVCGKTFELQSQLRHHIMMKHGKRMKPFKCKECPRAFSSKFNLNVHHQNHHVVKETSVSNEIVEIIESSPDPTVECNQENHQCLFCPKELLSLAHLKEHMKIHTSDQPFICSLCGKGFNNDTELSAHLITSHNRSDPFKCDICEKTYKSSTGLKNHLVIHSDYRQQMRKAIRAERKQTEAHESVSYSEQGLPQCQICKKEFTNNWVLKDHMKSHTNEKPFVCPICEKGFNKKYNLKIHVMAHKKIKPFKCDYCNQSFCTNAGRRIHHRSHMRNNDQTIAADAINNS